MYILISCYYLSYNNFYVSLAENGTIMIQFGQQVPNYKSSASDSPQEVFGMSKGSFNEKNIDVVQ